MWIPLSPQPPSGDIQPKEKQTMQTFLKIFAAILGEAEQIVPIFIHNPKSQQIEGVIVTTLNGALEGLGQQKPAPPAA